MKNLNSTILNKNNNETNGNGFKMSSAQHLGAFLMKSFKGHWGGSKFCRTISHLSVIEKVVKVKNIQTIKLNI